MAELKLTKEQQQLIVAGVLMTGALGFVYVKYFWIPTKQKIAEATTKLEGVNKKIKQAEDTARRLPQLQRQLAELEVLAQEAEEKLPKKKEVPKLIETLSDLAKEHRVDIQSISPAGSGKRENYQENFYSLVIQGSYHSVARFLTALGMEERILHSRNLTLSPITSALQPSFTVQASFTLVVYQYKG